MFPPVIRNEHLLLAVQFVEQGRQVLVAVASLEDPFQPLLGRLLAQEDGLAQLMQDGGGDAGLVAPLALSQTLIDRQRRLQGSEGSR